MSKKVFGKFLTGNFAVFNEVPTNEEEALQHGNALAYGKDSNYPVGTSNCFNVGISGGCGCLCFVIGENNCTIPDELYEQIKAGERDNEIVKYKTTENEDLNLTIKNRLQELNK